MILRLSWPPLNGLHPTEVDYGVISSPSGSAVKKSLQCRTQETGFRTLGEEDPLEEEMATYSSILAWRIPWIEEPDRLQSKGSLESDMT